MTSPLLVMQGDNDIRVRREEAKPVVGILKSEGRTVDAAYFPDEDHGFVKREHQGDEFYPFRCVAPEHCDRPWRH